jgi:hypothetical protein
MTEKSETQTKTLTCEYTNTENAVFWKLRGLVNRDQDVKGERVFPV